MRQYLNYTDADIIENAKHCQSIAGLLRSLGLVTKGGNYLNIKRKLNQLNVDTSHWTGRSWNKDKKLKDYSQYTRNVALKKHLLVERGHSCERCYNTEWMGVPITIELEHVDGDRTNNCPTNLLLLCPNCHALTPTWRGRKNEGTAAPKAERKPKCEPKPKPLPKVKLPKVIISKYCPTCNKHMTKNTKHCSPECASKSTRRIDWDSINIVEELKTKNFLQLGRELGVSDNAIRKQLKKLVRAGGLEPPRA